MTVQATILASPEFFETVEIEFRECELTYGSSPCTANLNNASACFKTRNVLNDCQDIDNFQPITSSLKFNEMNLSRVISDHRPLLKSVTVAPSKIPPRGGMANVSKAVFTFIDEPDTDQLDDNMLDRSYIAREQGTFWGKFKARNSFIQGQKIKYSISSLTSAGVIDTQSSSYWQIESISWPNKSGEVKITAKDPLNLTDALNAKCPPVSRVKLYSALSVGTNHLFLDSLVGLKSPDQLTILRIGDELMEVDGSTVAIQGDGSYKVNFTANGRGILGTVHAAHEVGVTVQEVARFDSLSIDATLAKIFNSYSEVYSDRLDTIGWSSQISSWRPSSFLTNYISEPTDIKTLISQICDQNQVMIWYSVGQQKIKLKAVAPELLNIRTYNDENDLWDLQVSEDDTLRLNTASMYFNPRSWIGGNKPSDFEDVSVTIDTLYYDLYGQPKERNLFSRWISSSVVALATTGVLINRFRASPFRIKFKMAYKATNPSAGDNFRISSRQFQDCTGAEYSPEFICISSQIDKDLNTMIEGVAYSYFAGNNGPIGAASFDGQNYSTYIAANPNAGGILAWISQADGTMVNGDDSYYIT
tara:strand:+ start:4941 stop:6704 length:1764 start_codon:yes stop_codon:yes gene_type:complete